MNILQLILFFIAVCFLSCAKEKTMNLYTEKSRDSMLLSHIAIEFDYQDAFTGEIAFQLKNLREGPRGNSSYSTVSEATLGDYRFKAFRFDTQRYPPFTIEVTTSDGELISYFTFTDELYYLGNGISAIRDDSLRFTLESVGLLNKANIKKVNLDRNLNDLLIKLEIKNDLPAIERLIDTIFNQLLKLEQYEDVEIDSLMRQIKTTDQLRSVLTSEYNLFCSHNSNAVFRFKAKEGVGGFWKLVILPTSDGYKITSRFFSDALYTALFM